MTHSKQELMQIVKKHAMHFSGAEHYNFLIEKAQGSMIWADDGSQVLDFTSGQMCSTLGHSHPAIRAAVEKAFAECVHLFSGYLAKENVNFMALLSEILPEGLSKMLFVNTGGESNEAALRLAKMYTQRYEIVALQNGWAGQTLGASSLTFYGNIRKGYGPAMAGSSCIPNPNCYHCPVRSCKKRCNMDCLEIGFEQVDAQTTSQPAAILVEPIQSGAGIIVPPKGYFKRMQALCRERNMLLIFDEAQTAFRTGDYFAYQHEDILPDILTTSKSLGGGLPLAAVFTSPEINETCKQRGFVFFTSHVNDPLMSYVGSAVLRTIIQDDLVAQSKEKGDYIMARLREMQQRYEVIGDVRGRGLLIGLEFVKDRETRASALAFSNAVVGTCFQKGLSINILHNNAGSVLRIGPPLTVTHKEIDQAMDILDEVIASLLSDRSDLLTQD